MSDEFRKRTREEIMEECYWEFRNSESERNLDKAGLILREIGEVFRKHIEENGARDD